MWSSSFLKCWNILKSDLIIPKLTSFVILFFTDTSRDWMNSSSESRSTDPGTGFWLWRSLIYFPVSHRKTVPKALRVVVLLVWRIFCVVVCRDALWSDFRTGIDWWIGRVLYGVDWWIGRVMYDVDWWTGWVMDSVEGWTGLILDGVEGEGIGTFAGFSALSEDKEQ